MNEDFLQDLTGGLPPVSLAIAVGGYLLGGFVKGAVGFALPLIAVAIGASVLPALTAVGLIILPVLVTNISQAMGQGREALAGSWSRFKWLIAATCLSIMGSAQMLPGMDERLFFIILGAGAGAAALIQLLGWRPEIPAHREKPLSLGVGLISGFFGGLAGIWGPPIILYFTALRLSKEEQVRAAGLVFLLGGLVLAPAHVLTGVLDYKTAMLSLLMIVPAMLGQWAGRRAQKRMNVDLFRKITLGVLLVVSLNLLRRAAMM